MAVVLGLYKRVAHRQFSFDITEVTGYGESSVEGHTEILLPGATVTIQMKYDDFKLLKEKHDAANKTEN
jgi:hypothetical protein